MVNDTLNAKQPDFDEGIKSANHAYRFDLGNYVNWPNECGDK